MSLLTVDKFLNPVDLSSVWAGIAARIKTEVSADTYDRWFREIELVELDAVAMTLRVPNNIFQFWIESNYLNLLRGASLLCLGSSREVKFDFAGEAAVTEPVAHPKPASKAPAVESEEVEAKP